MRAAKITIGAVSVILFITIILQSCVAGAVNILTKNNEISGSAGFIVAVLMFAAGIVGIATRDGRIGGYVAGAIYCAAALIGILNYGSYTDLFFWSLICWIFAGVFLIGTAAINDRDAKKG